MNKYILIMIVIFAVAGCASNSGVMPIGKDTFMVSRQAASGFSGSSTLKAEAFQEANSYCAKLGKSVQVVNSTEAQPPFLFGNFPKAEIQFMCLDNNDAELVRPKLQKTPDTVIEIKPSSGAAKVDTYTELKKLKELLDSGVITQDEFNAQKKKILIN
jgi:hypothetical protein